MTIFLAIVVFGILLLVMDIRVNDTIILVGMSNLGKSFWAPKLVPFGYKLVSIDTLILERLRPLLEDLGYTVDMDGMAEWMGQPFDERYLRNSALYLKYERREMWRVVYSIALDEKIVVDTTGSVIYTGRFLLWTLRLLSNMVLLDAPEGHEEVLYQQYLKERKPVYWGDKTYTPLQNEEPMAALARCYPRLLATRERRYYRLAHRRLPYSVIRKPDFTEKDFLYLAQNAA